MTTRDLAGHVALVTGSTAGIGRAIAEAFGERGSGLVAHGLEVGPGEDAVRAWRGAGWPVVGSDVDLGRPRSASELVEATVDAIGPIDILVLNASVELPQRLEDLTSEAIAIQLAVNVTASAELIRLCLPGMVGRRRGRIVAVGSVQEERPNARHLIYAATKAALTNMVLNVARHEVVPGVTANVIRPGAILTDRNRETLADRDYETAVLARIPAGRIGGPVDCAGIASFLCSDAGAYINGAVIAVDGGMRL